MQAWSRLLVAGLACVLMLVVGGWATIPALAEVSSEVFSAPASSLLVEGSSAEASTAAAQPVTEPVASESGVPGSGALTPEEAGEFGPSAEAVSSGPGSLSLSDGPLVVSGAPTEAEQLKAQEEARLASPEAVRAREESQTKYEGLTGEQADKIDGEAFPVVVNDPAGGPPSLPGGEQIVSYEATNAAAIALPDGKTGVIESLGPIATLSGDGQFTPINLALRSTGSGYAPANSDVAVQIPKQVSSGVSMSGDGVSLTPVDAHGQSLDGSEGIKEGASVVFANTQTDVDTLAKPTTGGFEIDSLLRSVESPDTLYFKVGMPAEARLVGDSSSGGARVVLNGQAIGGIALPGAYDAAGTSVPVQMSVSGDMLVVAVQLGTDEYQYPIEVDPQAYDGTLKLPGGENDTETNWRYHEEPAGKFKAPYLTGSGYVMSTQGAISEGEHDEFRYAAHGQASVGFIEEESSATSSEQSGAITKLEFAHGSTIEKEWTLLGPPGEYKNVKTSFGDLWNESEKHYRGYNNENLVRIMQTATKSAPEGYGFWFELKNGAWVGVNQEKGPEVKFDTTYQLLGGQYLHFFSNVLYGTGSWLGLSNGAVEILAKDPGLGVSDVKIRDLTAGPHGEHWEFHDPVYANHLCTGVWCNETFATNTTNGMYFTYSPEMAEGTNTFELCAENEALSKSCATATVNVDNTKPYGLKIASGLAESGAEVNATAHQVTVEASDATSGIRSIGVSIDGQEIGTLAGSCTGKCTASRTVTINGENLGAGEHKLFVTATDYADNVEKTEYTFGVRNATPVKIGPGTVDPVTGQFALSASDVDISGAGVVSRSYLSRALTAGSGGPVGPQWSLSAGTGRGLKLLADGNAELTSAGGRSATFNYKGGKFEAPKGDENITLEPKEETGKGITAYVLKDPAAGSSVTYQHPFENQLTIPTRSAIVSSYGSGSGNTNTYDEGVAVGLEGNVWVADSGNARMDEFNVKGEFVKAFGYGVKTGASELQTCTNSCRTGISGEGPGQLTEGWGGEPGVAVASNGDIWVSTLHNKLEEFTENGVFLGEVNGAGSSGAGGMKQPTGVAVDSKGNVWVADYGNSRVDEFNEKREFVKAFGYGVLDGASKLEVCTTSCQQGLKGKEVGELSSPYGIATRNGYEWVSDNANDRLEKYNEKGEYSSQFGTEGTGNGQFEGPSNITMDGRGDIWVVDWVSDQGRVQEFTEGGEYIGQLASSELNTYWLDFAGGLAVSSTGNLWIMNQSELQEWTHTTWLATKIESPASANTRATTYRTSMVQGQAVTEPIEELGPVPTGVSCGKNPAEVSQSELQAHLEELKAGCHALSFTYAEKTTATGESTSEWGEYNGRLAKVSFTGYNPSSKKMETIPIAEYLYDKRGQLRSEWDPRIEKNASCGGTCSSLKTTYGYDAEGHLTAITPAGQQPSVFTYGAITGDSNTGRLLKVTRAHPKTGESAEEIKKKLGEQKEPPKNTEAPKITGTAAVGVRLVVSHGVWSANPVAYAYQWEDCNSSGGECVAIAGATNANYTPVSNDVGHKLVAQIHALNSNGSVAAPSTASAIVVSSTNTMQSIDSGNSINAVSCISGTTDCIVSDSQGKALDSTNVSVGSSASWSVWSGPSGQSPSEAVDCPTSSLCLLADGAREGTGGNLYYASSLGGAWTQAYSPSYGVDAISCVSASFCVDGQLSGYYRYSTSPGSSSWTVESYPGSAAAKGVFCLSSSFCAIADSEGRVHIATSTTQIESSSWKETDVDGSTLLNGIACTSTSSCLAVDSAGSVLRLTVESSGGATASKNDIDGAYSLTGVVCPTSSVCVVVDSAGNVFVSKNGGETWTKQYSLSDKLTSVSCASSTLCLAADTTGNVTAFNPTATITEGESTTPQPGSTVEYRVPLSGGSAPNQMTSSEMAKWGQKNDLPVEATAIFPPDEPQGWPAGGYKRATLFYMDEHARTVNTASPSGAISTVEYSSFNEVTRTLSSFDRAIAMKESCESESKCKSAEVAKNLSSEKSYNSEGTELVEEVGPEHKIKLANGTEEEARDRHTFSYNEGAPSNGETYNVLTKSKQWSETVSKKELDVQVAHDYYNGQNNLGWKLRKPTETVSEIAGHTTTATSQYQPETGAPMEANHGEGFNGAGPIFDSSSGPDRGGHGVFNYPEGVAVDSKGNVWVGDTYNQRVVEFSATGQYLSQFGKWGTENGQMEYPKSVAVDGKGDIWIVDSGSNRIEEFTEAGAYVSKFGSEGTGNGQFKAPEGIAVDAKGNVWVVDTGNNRVQEFTEAGVYVRQFGSNGSGNGQFTEPRRVTVDSKGNVWVSDGHNCRVEEFNEKGEYLNQFGSSGSGNGQLSDPQGVAVDASGNIWVGDENNNRIEKFNEKREYVSQFGTKGSGNGQLQEEQSIALDSKGNVWAIDSGNYRVEEFSSSGAYIQKFGSKGTPEEPMNGPKGVAMDSKDDVWVADTYNNRIDEYNAAGEFMAKYGSEGTGNVQFKGPRAVAVDSKNNVWVADQNNNRIEELNEKGEFVRAFGGWGAGNGQFKEPQGVTIDPKGNLWVADTVNNRIQEFNEKAEYTMEFGVAGAGNGQLSEPRSLAVEPSGNIWVSDSNNNRLEEFNSKGEYITKVGEWGSKEGQFEWPLGISLDQHGRLWVADANNSRIQELTSTGTVVGTFGTAGSGSGQMNEPRAITIDPQGNAWVADTNNNRIERWTVATPANAQTIYYTAAANPSAPTCGERPEWANLVCQTEPLAQPSNTPAPPLPIVTTTYNMWDEPETIVEYVGSVTRTTHKTYDGAGRLTGTEESTTASEDAALPAVTDEYSAETGAMTKEAETLEGKARMITSAYNTLGQLITYTDAEGATTKFTYDIDARMEEVSEQKGSQLYAYDATTGFLTKVWDSAAGTFTATYGVSGEMLTEGYPNGMVAKYKYNTIGQITNLEYEKTTHCTEKCLWFSDADSFGAGGEVMSQVSTLSSESYSYNEEGELTQTQETPVGGKGCITRAYGYNEEGERTSLTTREPNEKGECTSEGGVVEAHSYDSAGRLVDSGVAYDALGNITKVPASDAGGQAITSTFYVDNQVATQEQNAKEIAYSYDSAGRAMLAKQGKTLTFSHYSGPGESLTWTCEEEEGKKECEEQKATKWTRNVPGIGGALDAIQTNGETPVLQVHDLEGNIVATVPDSETATGLEKLNNPTEFGVPNGGKAPKYAWLGASGAESELETGVITQTGATYVPQLARTAETEGVIPPGAAPNGVMATEAYCPPEVPWANESGNVGAENTVAQQRAKEREAEEALYAGGSDPSDWGLLTGHEAMEFAQELRRAALAVKVYGERTCPNAVCEKAAEADVEADTNLAVGLEYCSHHVKEGHRKYKGKTYTTTRVCLLHLNYNHNFLNWFHPQNGSQIWIGESLPFDGPGPSPWGNHGTQEWLFGDVEGKEEWWAFGNKRGWWRNLIS